MEHIDADTMEAAGFYFLELALVPQAWFEAQPRPVTVGQDDYYVPPMTWWRHQLAAISIHDFCDLRFHRTGVTEYYSMDGFYETAWTDNNNHRVEIIRNESDQILCLKVLIDVRTSYSEFLDIAITMAIEAQCLFYEYGDEIFFELSRAPVINAIGTHEMTHATVDASGRLTHH